MKQNVIRKSKVTECHDVTERRKFPLNGRIRAEEGKWLDWDRGVQSEQEI